MAKSLTHEGVMRFGKRSKLIPRFISLFDILRRVCDVTNELALPPRLSVVHPFSYFYAPLVHS